MVWDNPLLLLLHHHHPSHCQGHQGGRESYLTFVLHFQMVFVERGETISGGNFHGEYPAKALDYLAIAIHEIANMSERRLERLIHPGTAGGRGKKMGLG